MCMRFSNPDKSEILRRLYWERRLSIRQTAAVIGMSYQGTRGRLLKLGRLRSKAEGRTRYSRRSFSGEDGEKSYLLGLRAGDINAWSKSPNTIEVRVSTTHPAMSKLFTGAFEKYGHLMTFAERAYLQGHYRWQTKAHLDRSFEFLLPKPSRIPTQTEEFYQFLSGYSDAECCLCVYPKANRIRISWTVETLDARLIVQIKNKLALDGFHPVLYRKSQPDSGKKNHKRSSARKVKIRIRLNRTAEVVKLAKILRCYSKHAEKIAKMDLICSHPRGKWSRFQLEWKISQEGQSLASEYTRKEQKEHIITENAGVHILGSSASLVQASSLGCTSDFFRRAKTA